MKKDYFAILGVKPSASEKEIRSAYKRLAKKHHPDVNPGNKKAEEKFKEISEAYDVLTDPEKKRKWEAGDADFESLFRGAGGRSGQRGGGAGRSTRIDIDGMGDLGGIFGELFGGTGTARGRRARGPSAGADLQYPATISFLEAVSGTTLRIPLARTVVCQTCQGEGSVRRSGGSGRASRQVCAVCDETGRIRVNEDIQVRIPPGVDNGGKVRVPGRGEAGEIGGPPGDLYVELSVTPHPFYRREGRDIILDLPLTIVEATFGAKVDVPTIEGRVTLTVPPGAGSGQRMRLKGRGVPSRDGSSRGDQIVILQIVTPRSLDARSREILGEFGQLNPASPRTGLGWP